VRPRVKICGLTRVEDALLAAELGADLLGLNFFSGSPRCLTVAAARRIAAAVGGRVPLVGVFVNAGREELERIRTEIGLALLQLHGDEPDELVRELGPAALKVFPGAEEAERRLAEFPAAWGFLIDSGDRLRYGGTGESWEWRRLALPASGQPVLIAGGIGPDNARAALAATGAAGIDVGSRVESAPGIKDPLRLRRLFEEIEHGAMEVRT